MSHTAPYRIRTISDFHHFRGLPAPGHPLISVIDAAEVKWSEENEPVSMLIDFYSIALKRNPSVKLKYGQLECDFDEGIMFFMAPGQVLSIEPGEIDREKPTIGYIVLVHPDLLWNTALAGSMREYAFFDYSVNEALFLSEGEESMIIDIIRNIEREHRSNIDHFSATIIIAWLELLLTYAEKFYQRQFITRKTTHHRILVRLESVLKDYFGRDNLIEEGLPTVQYIADELNISPSYLSSLLTTLTGRSAQQHIHDKVIEKAKEMLSTTDLSISEIAYQLGFGHPQSFTRLFKLKTTISPTTFRQSFN